MRNSRTIQKNFDFYIDEYMYNCKSRRLRKKTMESYERTLRKVVVLEPEHISSYSLIIEEGTPFYERYGENVVNEGSQTMECAAMYPELPDEDTERGMYELTGSFLADKGYRRYWRITCD